jgi:hypothetical protein
MTPASRIVRFARSEDGSLLVFFMVCTVTILGIVALSFDMGRRAATQTDMQAFADNVALAAAGELNGSASAIDRATRAASTVINAANERIKAGTAGQTATLTIEQIVFYRDLPPTDGPSSFAVSELRDPASLNYKYRLPASDLGVPPDPTQANYVGILLGAVDVDWMFANVFNSSNLPDPAVRAIAVAGLSPWSCDVAPLMFCLPETGAAPTRLNPGTFARLRTARAGQVWQEGDFGFLSVGIDPAGPCASIANVAGQQACLITLSQRIASCFQTERADIVTGQRPSQETSIFNMGFDIYEQSMIQFASQPAFAPGPHSISGRTATGPGDVCTKSGPSDTMPFPPDDCYPACPTGRFGDGVWQNGRNTYVATNYTIWDVPFDPAEEDPRTAVVPGSFFDFPESGLSRYDFYLREIARAANGGVMPYPGSPYGPDNDGGRGTATPEAISDYTTWDDYWPDNFVGLNPIIPDAHGRADNGLPQCNPLASTDPDRRVILAAGIRCPAGTVTGNASDVRIEDFYRMFLLEPVPAGVGLPPDFELSVEVVQRLPVSSFAAHDVVQLYR